MPFVGQIFAHVLATVLAAPQGGGEILLVNGIVFGIARISDNLLVPRIMSKSVGISPIVVMFAVFAGGELFGLAGLLLGIPAAAMALVIWRFFRSGAYAETMAPASQPAAMAPEIIAETTVVVVAGPTS